MKRIVWVCGLLLVVGAVADGQMQGASTPLAPLPVNSAATGLRLDHYAGSETHLTLNVSKDNVLFGVRAVKAAGDRSLSVPPLPARQ